MTPRLRSRAPHERTLESLYRRHASEVYRYALMMLDSPADAEDVTQTTFLNAYRALLRGERPRSTGSWLRTITHNLCLQQFRQAARRPRQVELEDEPAELVSDHPAFLLDDLSRALRHIPVNQRAALLMRELEGRPIAEIASILGVSTSAVETLLFRARRGVREQLEGVLTCAEAEQEISRQLDGQLTRAERRALRAHLRECEECAHLARSLRAQRGALKSLAVIPLPGALAWSQIGTGATVSAVAGANTGVAVGGAWLAGSLGSKLAGATLVAALAAGAGYVAVKHPWSASRPVAKVPVRVAATGRPGIPAAAAVPSRASASTASAYGARRLTAPAHESARSSGAIHARATARAGAPHAATQAQSTTHSSASARTHGASSRVGRTHVKHHGHTRPAKRATHPAKPTHPAHPAKPAHPPHPVKPARPAHPAKPTLPSNLGATQH